IVLSGWVLDLQTGGSISSLPRKAYAQVASYFNHPSCMFDGRTIPHGLDTVAFVSKYVEPGQECRAQLRQCKDGTLTATFPSATSRATPTTTISCSFNGSIIRHGQGVVAWRSEIATASSPCASEARVCLNGNLSGTYTKSYCDPR